MASQKQNFTRSNVNEETLQISAPNRSSFDLSHRTKVTLPLGKLVPVNLEYLMPTDMLRGSLSPNIQLEKIATPELGRLRMDTHTFAVNARRINNQWRQFAESSRDYDSSGYKPQFNLRTLFNQLFTYILDQQDSDFSINALFEDPQDPDTWTWDVLGSIILNGFLDQCSFISSELLNTYNDYGYVRDFLKVEQSRFYQLLGSWENTSNHSSRDFIYLLCDIVQPFFGTSSILDMIGYPIVHRYSQSVVDWLDTSGLEPIANFDGQKFLEIFALLPDDYLDEMPLRAIYAAWYDYLRNFHVEKRTNILDPDDFDTDSIVKDFASGTFNALNLSKFIQLFTLKNRMYARDGLTTVQEDDKYRHVYVPIPDASFSGVSGFETPELLGDSDLAKVDNALSAAIQGVSTYFPGDGGWGDSDSVSIYKADLQVMKRTSMLYKYLARDFYNPDTYAGFVRARYSIVPDDINFLSSEYLGGDEVMISGEQLKANVTTEDTPAGTRTFTGGGSMSDSFSYRASDYCYLVSFVSLVPLVSYDAANMHMHELTPYDLPLPEFAEDTRVAVTAGDIVRGLARDTLLGFVPRYYGYRQRIDELHGGYLDTVKRSWDWTRDFYNMFISDVVGSGFTLNPYSLRIHLPLDAFLGLREWDNVAYGSCDCKMIIDRPLPAAVEFI